MKKYCIAVAALSLLCFSCNYETYYKSITDLKEVRAKTSMESFEKINDPIVITMPVYETMALFGNENMGTYPKRVGDMFVVYDWENNKIHDWCFFKGKHGWSNFRAMEMGNPVKYYDSGETIGCLSADGKLTTYKNTVTGTFTNLNNNQKTKSRYGLLEYPGYSMKNGRSQYRINIFDSETGIINKNYIDIDKEDTYIFFPFADNDGNYWIFNTFKNGKSFLNKIDCENNKAEQYPLFKNDEDAIYAVSDVFKNFIIVGDSEPSINPKIFVYDINEKTVMHFAFSEKAENKLSYYISVHTDDELYGIFQEYYSENTLSDKRKIYKFDIDKKEITYVTTFDFDMTETVYSRGNRIYFLNSRSLSKFICTYYDTASGQWGETFEISQEEILTGKKEATENNNL